MDKIELKLCSNLNGDIDILLQSETENTYFDIPTGKEVIYNDNMYWFCLSAIAGFPTKVYINDEMFEPYIYQNTADIIKFGLKVNDERPFLRSFGAVKIALDINGQKFVSRSIAVMVSNTNENKSVLNMIEYIYDNCDSYLYEKIRKSEGSGSASGDETISLDAKINFLNNGLKVFMNAYQHIKISPYSKLKKIEAVDTFDKLQTVTVSTIRYISSHADELVPVNYNTGIRYNNQYYQPNRTLTEKNVYSFDTYENQVIVGFLSIVTADIAQMIKQLRSQAYSEKRSLNNVGYIDSMYKIFSRSLVKINGYINQLAVLKDKYQQMFCFYSKLFGIKGIRIEGVPLFSPVFKTKSAYHQIYQIIYNWFTSGSYNLGKDSLMLSFVSTSKIYEYYCLIKLLDFLDKKADISLIDAVRVVYKNKNRFYTDTRYNNTFIFSMKEKIITLYFQPVICGDDQTENGIEIFRNTSSCAVTGNENKGWTYTPDYIVKIEDGDKADYIIIDAKFSTSENIRNYSLQELVYKYLFSLSPLNSYDSIKGLYIICGKSYNNDKRDLVHDLASYINHKVRPFAEILVMTGDDISDTTIPEIIFDEIISE